MIRRFSFTIPAVVTILSSSSLWAEALPWADASRWQTFGGEWKLEEVDGRQVLARRALNGGVLLLKGLELEDFCIRARGRTGAKETSGQVFVRAQSPESCVTAAVESNHDLLMYEVGSARLGTWHHSWRPEANTWYEVKVQAIGPRVMMRVWPEGTDEPGDWRIDVVDERHRRGSVGFGS